MARVFYKGQTLTPNDLKIILRDVDGSVFDPAELTYTLVDSLNIPLSGLVNQIPTRTSIGTWFADTTIPSSAVEGEYFILWKIKETLMSDYVEYKDFFDIIGDSASSKMSYPESLSSLLHKLRIRLGDNDPDRNYRFAPPKSPNEVNNFTTNHGFIWQDYELISFLEDSVGQVNWYMRGGALTVESVPPMLKPMVLLGAMVYAVEALSLIWIQDEFGYSLNGISLDLTKSEKYRSALNDLRESLRQELENLQNNRSHVIKGLRQNRFSVGYSYGRGQYTYRGAGAGSWRRKN